MPFPCPGCLGAVEASPEAWLVRCHHCGGLIRCRSVPGTETTRAYDVQIVGRPETGRQLEIPWTDSQQTRLEAWLRWWSLLTLGLVGLLYVLARWLAS